MSDKGWYAFDLDGTLAEYRGWSDIIGPPIPMMVQIAKGLIDEGEDVRILTARATSGDLDDDARQRASIATWCHDNLGRVLPITDRKDLHMIVLYDDRAIGVEKNTGRLETDIAYRAGYKTAMDRVHWGSWDVS